MLKPPHPVARLAYALAMFINPNNHALDGGRATSALEKEAVAEIAAMFGWQNFLGHLTGGGTMANLEALWVAGQLAPGKKILASEQSHYTHHRISSVLKLDFDSIPVDAHARMDLNALEKRLAAKNDVGTIVVTMGTTATGSVDPLPEILQLRDRYNFRIHADAAYGGYFTLAQNLAPQATAAFAKISEADSIVIDPHKHGLQPYGCGCVLFRDPSVGRLYKHDSPYTYFSSAELHLGEISLECSRPGAAAAALWATQKLLPLTLEGEFAQDFAKGNGSRPRAPQETQDQRQIHPRIRTRTRHRNLRPNTKIAYSLASPKSPPTPAASSTPPPPKISTSPSPNSPPPSSKQSPRHHPPRQIHRHRPPLRPHETRTRPMARPHLRNPHLGLVAPASCRRF